MKKHRPQTVGWPQACRDVFIAAINRGQLPILGVFAVVILITCRLPESELSIFAKDVLAGLKRWQLVGYAGWGATLIAWVLQSQSMRQQFSAEYERIGKEKSSLQSAVAGIRFKSSD